MPSWSWSSQSRDVEEEGSIEGDELDGLEVGSEEYEEEEEEEEDSASPLATKPVTKAESDADEEEDAIEPTGLNSQRVNEVLAALKNKQQSSILSKKKSSRASKTPSKPSKESSKRSKESSKPSKESSKPSKESSKRSKESSKASNTSISPYRRSTSLKRGSRISNAVRRSRKSLQKVINTLLDKNTSSSASCKSSDAGDGHIVPREPIKPWDNPDFVVPDDEMRSRTCADGPPVFPGDLTTAPSQLTPRDSMMDMLFPKDTAKRTEDDLFSSTPFVPPPWADESRYMQLRLQLRRSTVIRRKRESQLIRGRSLKQPGAIRPREWRSTVLAAFDQTAGDKAVSSLRKSVRKSSRTSLVPSLTPPESIIMEESKLVFTPRSGSDTNVSWVDSFGPGGVCVPSLNMDFVHKLHGRRIAGHVVGRDLAHERAAWKNAQLAQPPATQSPLGTPPATRNVMLQGHSGRNVRAPHSPSYIATISPTPSTPRLPRPMATPSPRLPSPMATPSPRLPSPAAPEQRSQANTFVVHRPVLERRVVSGANPRKMLCDEVIMEVEVGADKNRLDKRWSVADITAQVPLPCSSGPTSATSCATASPQLSERSNASATVMRSDRNLPDPDPPRLHFRPNAHPKAGVCQFTQGRELRRSCRASSHSPPRCTYQAQYMRASSVDERVLRDPREGAPLRATELSIVRHCERQAKARDAAARKSGALCPRLSAEQSFGISLRRPMRSSAARSSEGVASGDGVAVGRTTCADVQRRHEEIIALREERTYYQLALTDKAAADWQLHRKKEIFDGLRGQGILGPFPPQETVADEIRRRYHIIECLKKVWKQQMEHRHLAESLLADVRIALYK